jgi:hypothetical protein
VWAPGREFRRTNWVWAAASKQPRRRRDLATGEGQKATPTRVTRMNSGNRTGMICRSRDRSRRTNSQRRAISGVGGSGRSVSATHDRSAKILTCWAWTARRHATGLQKIGGPSNSGALFGRSHGTRSSTGLFELRSHIILLLL